MPILEVKKLSMHFGGLAAVSNLDLTIQEGEIRGIIGPNGAGKTTLFNVISGVYRPTSGQILYRNGEQIGGLTSSKIAKMGIIRTFQRTAIYHEFTVLQNVTVARHLHGRESIISVFTGARKNIEKENRKKATEIVAFMGLGHLENELAVNLPHGHQRALGVAIALACEPNVLLLDEPLFDEKLMGLAEWLADRYVCSPADAMRVLLPSAASSVQVTTKPPSAVAATAGWVWLLRAMVLTWNSIPTGVPLLS